MEEKLRELTEEEMKMVSGAGVIDTVWDVMKSGYKWGEKFSEFVFGKN